MKRDIPDGESAFWPEQGALPGRVVHPARKGALSGLGGLLRRARGVSAVKHDARTEIPAAVRELLVKKNFFERLDDRLCPKDSSQSRTWCQGGFELAARILSEAGMKEEGIQQVLQAFVASGSECDCGVLYNSPQQSRLKTEYWLARALGERPCDPHSQMRQD